MTRLYTITYPQNPSRNLSIDLGQPVEYNGLSVARMAVEQSTAYDLAADASLRSGEPVYVVPLSV